MVIFIISLFISFSTVAQVNNFGAFAKEDFNKNIKIDLNQRICKSIPKKEFIGLKSTNSLSAIPLGTSDNIYSILSDYQNQVAYNSKINTIAFSHRQNAGDVGGSGVIAVDFSTDGGATWAIDTHLTTAIINGTTPKSDNNGRYPNVTIYNPAGNTNVNEAFLVGAGPLLGTFGVSGYGWGMQYAASYKLDGNNLDEKYFTTTSDTNDWAPRGICSTDDAVWFVTTNNDNDNDTTNPILRLNTNYYIYKGVLDTITNNFIYSIVDTLKPDLYQIPGSNDNYGYNYNMAFSTDGQIGYVVILGIEDNLNIIGIHPIVYKSSDAGLSWSKLPDFNFANIPAISDSVRNTWANEKIPFWKSMDIAVDSVGELHVFGVVGSGYSSHVDSLTWSFTHPSTKFLFDVRTVNGINWDAYCVDNVYNEEYDLGGDVIVNSRPQAATSPNGDKVFFTWLKTDGLLYCDNNNPNIMSVGYSVCHPSSSDGFSAIKNLTSGNTQTAGLCFYATMAPIVSVLGNQKDYELQIVFVDLYQQGTINPNNPVQYMYISGVGFDSHEVGGSSYYITENYNICSGSSYTFPDSTILTNITSQVTHNSNFQTIFGCDSIIETTINMNPIYNVTESVSICPGSSYTFPDSTVLTNITSQVTHNSNLQTILGCDSIIETTINMNPVYNVTESVSICPGSSYTFPDSVVLTNITSQVTHNSNLQTVLGCDSIIETTINMNPIYNIVENIGVCPGSSYTFPDGVTQSNIISPVSHTSNMLTTQGCDSIITSNITINPLPQSFAVTGGGTYNSGGAGVHVGLSDSEIGVNYTLLLDSLVTISNEAGTGNAIDFGNQTLAGIYTIKAENDTTYCINYMYGNAEVIIYTYINNDINDLINIYPNPSTGLITVEGKNINKLEVINPEGKIIKIIYVDNNLINIDISNYSKGVYLIKVISSTSIYSKKIILE